MFSLLARRAPRGHPSPRARGGQVKGRDAGRRSAWAQRPGGARLSMTVTFVTGVPVAEGAHDAPPRRSCPRGAAHAASGGVAPRPRYGTWLVTLDAPAQAPRPLVPRRIAAHRYVDGASPRSRQSGPVRQRRRNKRARAGGDREWPEARTGMAGLRLVEPQSFLTDVLHGSARVDPGWFLGTAPRSATRRPLRGPPSCRASGILDRAARIVTLARG